MIFNKRFGRFTLVKKLAMGGMAEVYLAMKRGPDRFEKLVALKKLHEHMVSDADHVSMFFQEARLGGLFDHPNLVTVYDAEEIEGRPTMVMEFVPGATVDELTARCAERSEPLPVPIAMAIVSEAAHGLHAAHTAVGLDGAPLRIVHRDVSPHNILVGWDGAVRGSTLASPSLRPQRGRGVSPERRRTCRPSSAVAKRSMPVATCSRSASFCTS